MVPVAALIFAKYPTAGAVKTRMTPPLAAEEAAELHEACLRMVCENVAMVGTLETKLVVTPDDRAIDLARRIGMNEHDCWPQGDGDLGDRLSHAVERALNSASHRVLLLGADSPTLPTDVLAEAVKRLINGETVLGSCDDGGYYLLGLCEPMPAMFDGIDWGGADVAQETRDRAVSGGVGLHELGPWYDLDRFGDLTRALADLTASDLTRRPMADALRRRVETLIRKYGQR